jgi:hypothetical protein
LLVAWQHPQTRTITPVGVLEERAAGYSFAYLRRALKVPGFQTFIGFDDLRRRYESPVLFSLFRQRLMDPRRPDYDHYMDVLGLDKNSSPLEVLGRSEGGRAGDSIFLIREPDITPDGQTTCTFFVHGVRHVEGAAERIAVLQPGEELLVRDDRDNPSNPHAVLVSATDQQQLGWVPDALIDYVQTARTQARVSVRVKQVNDADVPPNLRLLVQLHGRVPSGYQPFAGDEWQTLA